MSEIGPSSTAFYRVLLALPALWMWAGLEARTSVKSAGPKTRADYGWLILAGLFFTADLAFWHWSIKMTSVANATLLANFAPIFVTLGAAVLFGEKPARTFLVALALSIVGAVFLMGASFQLNTQHFVGDLLGIATAVFYGAYQLSVNRLRRRFSTGVIMAWVGMSATAGLFVVAVFSGEGLNPETARGWLVLIGLALVSHVAGQGLIAYAFGHLAASFGSLGLLLQPIVAAVLAWFLFEEALSAIQAAGAALTLSGLYIARKHASRPAIAEPVS